FKPIWLDHIMSGRIQGGYGLGFGYERLLVFERFYQGGPNSNRAFKPRQVSAIDEFGTRSGATSEVLVTLDYIVPLLSDIRLVSGTAAQGPAPAAVPAVPAVPAVQASKIGYIDVQRVLARSAAGVAAREQLEKERAAIQKDMDGRRVELEKLRDEIEKKGALMTADARREKQEVFERKRRDAARAADDYQKELEKKEGQ